MKVSRLTVAALLLCAACGRARSGGLSERSANRAIQNKGSDTLLQLAEAWAEAYRNERPDVTIAVTGGGTGTGFAALLSGTADIANASRAMTSEEIAAARSVGIEPVHHTVALDALAVIVHPTNPVDRLTIGQIADIYTGRVTNWRAVGGTDSDIVLLSRETNSGTHVYFLEHVVRQGQGDNKDIFAAQTLLMPSSVGITSEIQRNPRAIGYDGLGYVTAAEKVLAVGRTEAGPYVLPSSVTAMNGTYPLARSLHVYTAGEPTGEIAEYIHWITGAAGQSIVQRLRFVPAAPFQQQLIEAGDTS